MKIGKKIKLTFQLFAVLGIAICTARVAVAATIVVRPPFYVYIVGPIIAGDYDRFVYQLKHSTQDIEYVMLAGPGGNVQEALKLGRLIRWLNLLTYAPATEDYAASAREMTCHNISEVDRSVPCSCASACFLIWAAGENRFGNDLLIHSIAYDKAYYSSLSPNEAATLYKTGVGAVQDYLKEMDMPDKIFEEMLRMPSAMVMPLPIDDYNNAQFSPSYREWIYARCSRFPITGTEFGPCMSTEMHNAAVAAVHKFRLEN